MSVDERLRNGLREAAAVPRVDTTAALVEVENMETQVKKRRGVLLAVAAAAVVVAGLVWGPGLLDSLGGGTDTVPAGTAEDPAPVLAAYEDARNSNDYDALRALYADDAVITGHPLDTSDPQVADADEIVALETQRGNEHPDEETIFVDVEVSGDRATFAHLFFAYDGNCYGSRGDQRNEITVQDGKITTYTWDVIGSSQTCDPELLAEAGVEQ